MAWPCHLPTWGEGIEAARRAYAETARAIAEFEPVTMVARPEHVAVASLQCGGGIEVMALEIDDSWLRDNGPTFVIDGADGVAGVDWRFNAWGNLYQDHRRDAAAAEHLLDHLGMRRYEAPLVLEGGSIHVDGEGTVLTSEQCLLNPNRNPGLDRQQIEERLAHHLGVRKVVWLGEGLQDDETDGHVDNLACFARPGVVLALSSDDESEGNHRALSDNLARLRAATDARGRAFEVIEVPQPSRRDKSNGARIALSYVNFYLSNGGVVLPAFDDANDARAFDIIAKAFPDRRAVQVPASDITLGGGGIHCITQQQPEGDALPATGA
jgi:agmatine deiminase